LRGRLKPHDPFELIRWLAFSQPDPRKALAELVQNSLDAGAGKITISCRREHGAPSLLILDDGHGVIPEDQPGAPWRSRMLDGRWQVNTGHRDYRGIADRPALKLRYLAMLFAKEVVARSHNDPRLERPLEQLVEIACFADRNLSKPGRKKSPAPPAG
jgi:hypothetical protein